MSDESFSTPLPSSPKPAPKKCGKRKCAFLIVLVLIALAAIALRFCPFYTRWIGAATQSDTVSAAQIEQRLTGLENSVRSLDERVSTLTTVAVDKTGETPNALAAAPKQSAADIARLQSDLVALSAALTSLQAEIKESHAHSLHSQQEVQGTLAAAVDFVQLRMVAETGAPFASEFAALHEASRDPGLQALLAKIEPFASSGAPTVAQLSDRFLSLEAQAQNAVDKNQAQNWWQRFVVQLKGLVSIRKLHDGMDSGSAFGAIEKDLENKNLVAALQKTGSLPPEAQNILKDWREQAQARQTLDETLQQCAAYLNGLMKPAPIQDRP